METALQHKAASQLARLLSPGTGAGVLEEQRLSQKLVLISGAGHLTDSAASQAVHAIMGWVTVFNERRWVSVCISLSLSEQNPLAESLLHNAAIS